MHNMYEAYYRVYASLNVRDIDGILRPQNSQRPKDPSTENGDVLDGMQLKAFAGQQHDAHIANHLMMGLSPILGTQPMAAMALQKHILEHVRLKAEEDTEVELFKQYGMDPGKMVSDIQREGMIAVKCAQYMQQVRDMQNQLAGGSGAPPDPVVALKEQELKQQAAKDQADLQVDKEQLAIDREKIAQSEKSNQMRVQTQQNIADQRAEVARERATILQQGMERRNAN
jgi:hypothetical protein